MNIAILPGDGIGPEIVAEAVRVLDVLDLPFNTESALVGGAAYEAHGHPLPDATLKLAQDADAVLFGAVGDWKFDTLERSLRPEQAILGLRKHLQLFANFRPAICYPQLTHASSLKPELIGGLIVRIADTVYDHSVATSLVRLRARLKQRSIHEIQYGRDRLGTA